MKVEIQYKETRKTIQDMQDEVAILRGKKKKMELLELKNSLKEFQIQRTPAKHYRR